MLSNIYLDRLDTFVEQTLLPEYNYGDRRRRNRAYEVIDDQIAKARRRGDRQAVRTLVQRRRRLPSQDPNDPDYRRLRYVRYCDDWLLAFAGPGTRPNGSRRGSGRSCASNSSWNCPSPRR